ncbi:MAG: TonB-dependent receptor [Bacteroidales bacterium]|nr:TonB-dependent receptor [Bacteroidales bacterium]
MKIKKIIIAALFLSVATFNIYADNKVKTDLPIDTISLNEIVVTATRNPIIRKLAPSLVSVLPHKIFEDTQASCLAQGLNFVPGVRVENNCQNCGWTQARINGLDGHYSQILIDSRPLFSALTNVYGLEQLPANMIDHVEVIRGGGSALFGSSAIGGTINVITREPSKNGAEIEHTITSIGGKNVFENNTTMDASIVSNNKKAGLIVFGSNRYRQPYDADGDGFSELNKIKTKSIGARLIMKPVDNIKLSFDYRGISDYRRGGDNINLPPHEANLAETTEHTINAGGLNFDWGNPASKDKLNAYVSFQNTDRNSYYGADKSLNNYGLTHDLTYVLGGQYTHQFDKLLFMPSVLTLGSEYNSDKINDESIENKVFTNQLAHTSSAFFQNEWRNDKISLLFGGRLDKHNMVDHVIFSPRVNLRYTPSDAWNFRVSMSGGFRAPQAYDEDLHVDLVNGDRRVVRLANNLHEENSTSWSGSLNYHHRFGSVITDFIFETFYTDLRHTFAIRELGQKTPEGDEIDERYNASGAKVYGVNMELQASFNSFIDWQAGLTLQRSRYNDAQQWSDDPTVSAETKMFRTPNVYGYLTTDITPVKRLSISLTGDYTGSMLVQHKAGSGVAKDVAVTTPRFFDANIKVAYDIPLCSNALTMRLSGGMLNAFNSYQKDFDKGADRDSNYIYGPMMPRSYYAAVKFLF